MRAVFILAAITFAAPLSAADANFYRNGQTFASTPAPSAAICEMQCSGDAQCRSWNFLPPRIPGALGQCQLNATSGQAVSHPFATSGAAPGAQQSYDGRVIAAGTRTKRIGQPVAAPAPRVIRQAIRRPVPMQQRQVMRPAAPQTAPQLRQAVAPRVQMPRPVVRQRQLAPAPRPQAPQRPASKPQIPTQSAPMAAAQAPAPAASMSLTEQQNLQRFGQSAPMRAPAAAPAVSASPRTLPATTPRMPAAPSRLQRPAPAPIPPGGFAPLPIQDQAGAPAMDRLYGSLYDDAGPQKMKMPLYSERPADDLDAPVVTTVPAPTTPVSVDRLPLAGGPL